MKNNKREYIHIIQSSITKYPINYITTNTTPLQISYGEYISRIKITRRNYK